MGSSDIKGERRKSSRQVKPSVKSKRNENGNTNTSDQDTSPNPELNLSTDVKKEEEIVSTTQEKQAYGWQHPAELDYFTPSDWNDTKIIHHLIAHAFDVPPKHAKSGQPFCHITDIKGTKTILPSGYRIPLMFLARFQWLSLKLVLSAGNREVEWEEYKFGILHVSRLCKRLLESAQDALGVVDAGSGLGTKAKSKGVDRKWRCQTFDRALVRYKLRWFISKPALVKEFWHEYGESEYDDDVVSFGWRQWALKGHRGFSLTQEELDNGITARQLMQGLKEKDGRWLWEIEGAPVVEGTDAWSLRHMALAAIPTLTTPSPPPSVRPASCTPLTTTKTSNVGIVPPASSTAVIASPIPPSTTSTPTDQSTSISQFNPPSSAKPKVRVAFNDMMRVLRSAGVEIPFDDDVSVSETNGANVSTGGSISGAANANSKQLGKRPGSPLEKEGSPKSKRPSEGETSGPSSSADPDAPPFTPTLSSASTIRRERSLDPDVEILPSAPSRFKRRSSAKSLHSDHRSSPSSQTNGDVPSPVMPTDSNENLRNPMGPQQNGGDDSMVVDSISSAGKLPPTKQPTAEAVVIPSKGPPSSSSITSASKPVLPVTRSVPNDEAVGNLQSSQTSTHISPPRLHLDTQESIRSLQQQWQQSQAKPGSEGTPASSSMAMNSAPSSTPFTTDSRTALSSALANSSNNVKLIDSLFLTLMEEMKKFSGEIKQAKEHGVSEIRDVIREIVKEKLREELPELLRGVTQAEQRTTENDDEIPGLGSGVASGKADQKTEDAVRRAIAKEMGGLESAIGEVVKESVASAVGSLKAGLVEEIRQEVLKSEQRSKELNTLLNGIRGEMEFLRNGRDREGGGGSTTGPHVEPLDATALLSSHPLAHLLGEPESDSDEPAGQHRNDVGAAARSYSGTPMSMSPEIVLLEPGRIKRKHPIPDVESGDTPMLPPRLPSPILDDEITDVKPVIIGGEAYLPETIGGGPTPLTAFSSPVPAKSHRKFRKMGISSSGDSSSAAAFSGDQ